MPGTRYFDVDAIPIAQACLYLSQRNLSESPWLPQAFDAARFIAACGGDSEE